MYKEPSGPIAILSDAETAQLLTYIREEFGDHAGGVVADEVQQTRSRYLRRQNKAE